MACKLFLLLCALARGSEDESILLQTDPKPEVLATVKQPLTNLPVPSQESDQAIIDEIAGRVEKDMQARVTLQMCKLIAEKYSWFSQHLQANMHFLSAAVDLNITKKFNKDQSPQLQYRILEESLREIIGGTHSRLLPGMGIFKDYIAGVFIGLKLIGSPKVGDDWNRTMSPVIRAIDTFDHTFIVANLELAGVHDLNLQQTVKRIHLVDTMLQEAVDEIEITKSACLEGSTNLIQVIKKAIKETVPEEHHEKLNTIMERIVTDTENMINKIFIAIRDTETKGHMRVDEALKYLGASDEELSQHHYSAGAKFGLGLAALVLGALAF